MAAHVAHPEKPEEGNQEREHHRAVIAGNFDDHARRDDVERGHVAVIEQWHVVAPADTPIRRRTPERVQPRRNHLAADRLIPVAKRAGWEKITLHPR